MKRREKIFVLSAGNRKLGYWRTGTHKTETKILQIFSVKFWTDFLRQEVLRGKLSAQSIPKASALVTGQSGPPGKPSNQTKRGLFQVFCSLLQVQ